MKTATLADEERKVLAAMHEADPDGEHQFNEFWGGFGDLAFTPVLAQTLRALKRRKLVGGSGRGKWAVWWIEQAGREALTSARQT
jgi:hypothetical protein